MDEHAPATTIPFPSRADPNTVIWQTLPDDGYAMTKDGLRLEVRYLHRERGELHGEMTALCEWYGARTYNGLLGAPSTLNLGSGRSRRERAKEYAERAASRDDQGRPRYLDFDWVGFVEEFACRVAIADQHGTRSQSFEPLEPSALPPEEAMTAGQIVLPALHPVIFFGDGAACKSYLGMYLAGELAKRGVPVLYADWELAFDDHQRRYTRIFRAQQMPMRYLRFDRPLIHAVPQLRREIADHHIQYVILDSISASCEGPPESAEVASSYLRAVRQLGIGALLFAHINKTETGDQKPFGSAFWHNLVRGTWFVKRAEGADPAVQTIGLFPRKPGVNRAMPPATALRFRFNELVTDIEWTDITDEGDLVERLPLWQRVRAAVKHHPLTYDELAEELGAKRNSIVQSVARQKGLVLLPGSDGLHRVAQRAWGH